MSSKKSFIIFIFVGVFLLVAPYTSLIAAEVNDVPPGHWAYEAVTTLLDKGYLPLGEDMNFNGEDPVDRYTLASVVAKILIEIESGRVQTTSQDVQTLKLLTDELREDLVKYYSDLQLLDGKIENAHEEIVSFGAKLAEVIREIGRVYQMALDLESGLSNVNADITQLEIDQKKALQNEVSLLSSSMAALGESLEVDLRLLQQEVDNLSALLDQRSSELTTATNSLRADVISINNSLLKEVERRLAEESDTFMGSLESQATSLFSSLSVLEDEVYSHIDPLINELDQRLLEVQNELVIKDAYLSTLKNDMDNQVSTLQQQLNELSTSLNDRIEKEANQLLASQELLDSALNKLLAEHGVKQDQLADDVNTIESTVATLKNDLNAYIEQLALYDQQVKELTSELEKRTDVLIQADVNLLADLDALRNNQASLTSQIQQLQAGINLLDADVKTELDSIKLENQAFEEQARRMQADILEMQSNLGLSGDYVEQLATRIWDEILLQHGDLTDVYTRNQQLNTQLSNLKADFDEYKINTEQELKSLRSTSALSIGALVLAIVGIII